MTGYPGPFKCPDCGVWWAGFTHKCPLVFQSPTVVTSTVRCTCGVDDQGNRIPLTSPCPVHDVQMTYTYGGGMEPRP